MGQGGIFPTGGGVGGPPSPIECPRISEAPFVEKGYLGRRIENST